MAALLGTFLRSRASFFPSRLATVQQLAFRNLAAMASGSFKQHEVCPDVLDIPPENTLTAKYDSGVEANLGNVLTPTQVKNPPKVSWEASGDQLYTLLMTDPDAPSRKEATYREWHHWLVVNIPGNDISKGDVLAEYVGSGPPEGTGESRGCFKTRDFVKKHGLGTPIAGNLYQAEWDDYVPILYKQLGA